MNKLMDKVRRAGLVALVGTTMVACQPKSSVEMEVADVNNDGVAETLCKPPELEDFERFVENNEALPLIERFLWYSMWGEVVPGVDFDPLLLMKGTTGPGRGLYLLVESENPEKCSIAIDRTYKIFNQGNDGVIRDTGTVLRLQAFPIPPGSPLIDVSVSTIGGKELFYIKR